ncbi:MAG: DMT family transporter [Saprospiraceae bacterium]|jgi:drug/metabolite transporter (DMT)-like permease|nr:DMT family transporter [Saprospiraceae bacterium]
MSKTLKAHLSLFAVALIYGANYSIAKIVLDDHYLQPISFITLRICAAAILFTLFHQIWIKEKVERKDFPLLILCSLFGAVFNQLFFFLGLKETSPINASLIMTTTPILILIISAILIREKVTWSKVVGIILGGIGATIIISAGKEVSFTSNQALGNLYIFVNASSYGIYLVLIKRLMDRYHPITLIRWIFTIGAIIILPFGIPYLNNTEWHTFSPLVIGSVIYVLLFTTFFTYLLNGLALRELPASIVGIYIYLQPLIATIIALIIGNDQLNALKILAGILIFTGVFLVSQPIKTTRN